MRKIDNKVNVGIIGVSGYTGFVLLKILASHPHFDIKYLATRNGGEKLSDVHPQFDKIIDMDIEQISVTSIAKTCDLVFLALPHGSSFAFVKELLNIKKELKIVDLSADYRLNIENYNKTYDTHLDPLNLKNATYGLVEYNKTNIAKSFLVANPGCYPTATLLALLPFVHMIHTNIFIDAKSGVSGAGKKLSDTTHYPFINENIFAYSPITHRHAMEIDEKLKQFAKIESKNISFVPHLTPLNQGMLVNVYATLKDEFKDIDPIATLKARYKNDFFVRIKNAPVNVLNVRESNFCDIYAMNHNGALFINSSIDNLWRGASSQAIVNANLMYGFDENSGLV